jgi:hypothetical protein
VAIGLHLCFFRDTILNNILFTAYTRDIRRKRKKKVEGTMEKINGLGLKSTCELLKVHSAPLRPYGMKNEWETTKARKHWQGPQKKTLKQSQPRALW